MPLLTDGKEYTIPLVGKIVLYPISKISQVLTDAGYPRDTQTIRKWELSGVIPTAPFRNKLNRLYSAKHIEELVRAVVECDIKRGIAIESTDFSERVCRYWIKVGKELMNGVDKNGN